MKWRPFNGSPYPLEVFAFDSWEDRRLQTLERFWWYSLVSSALFTGSFVYMGKISNCYWVIGCGILDPSRSRNETVRSICLVSYFSSFHVERVCYFSSFTFRELKTQVTLSYTVRNRDKHGTIYIVLLLLDISEFMIFLIWLYCIVFPYQKEYFSSPFNFTGKVVTPGGMILGSIPKSEKYHTILQAYFKSDDKE